MSEYHEYLHMCKSYDDNAMPSGRRRNYAESLTTSVKFWSIENFLLLGNNGIDLQSLAIWKQWTILG